MFCKNCGNVMSDNAKFCATCGTMQSESSQYDHQKPVMAQQISPPVQKKRKKGTSILIILVGIALVLLGIAQFTLTIAGKTTKGQIVRTEQKMYLNNDESTRDPTRYTLYYEFTVKGEKYSGSVTKKLKYGLTASSDGTRPAISVRYLPFWPHINTEENDTVSITGFFLIGLGILLFILEARAKKKRNTA